MIFKRNKDDILFLETIGSHKLPKSSDMVRRLESQVSKIAALRENSFRKKGHQKSNFEKDLLIGFLSEIYLSHILKKHLNLQIKKDVDVSIRTGNQRAYDADLSLKRTKISIKSCRAFDSKYAYSCSFDKKDFLQEKSEDDWFALVGYNENDTHYEFFLIYLCEFNHLKNNNLYDSPLSPKLAHSKISLYLKNNNKSTNYNGKNVIKNTEENFQDNIHKLKEKNK